MSYKDKPQIKLYKYENSAFVLQAIIDDFQEVSFEHNIYEAGTFTITINYNIPNALKFERGLFCQFGNNPYDFGEIITIQDAIGQDGKGSQIRTITGRDARYILKRRVIKNMNSNGLWAMTDKGEIVLRNLIKDQCGSSAETKRQLPIANTIPASSSAKGKEYSASENFSNLYEVCKTIATQSEIGWRMAFDGTLTLEVFEGADLSQTVRFDTSYESLANGDFTDSSDAYSNAIYIGGKGQNDDRDIYEGEDGTPEGLDRFESWDNQSSLTVESEYEAEALSMLTQYGQTLTMNGNGLAKCPYVFREQYDIGDTVTVAFSGKSAKAQILSITEHWTWGSYDISFSFGKPQNNLSDQLQLMLRKIQEASNKTNSTDSVRWYTIPTDTTMPKADVTYNTIGFVGTVNTGATFTLYLDSEKTGAKTYHVYFKQLGGTGKLTLTTGKAGATNLEMMVGTYVAIIYVDENGNITNTASTPTDIIASGNNQPATSNGVASAISSAVGSPDVSNATGVLPIAHGGTGQTDLANVAVGSAGKWTTARDIKIQDSDGTNTGSAVSVDGSENETLKLPSTIKASITGNCSGSSGSCTGNSATATSATRLGSIAIANIRIGSSQAKISLNQLMTWLITTQAYIPSGVDCYKVLGVPWDYSGNDILQLSANGVNYELQLAGCLIEFMGNATNYNTGRFRLIIHSSPTNSFTVSSNYEKFPVSTAVTYTCNGSGYTPIWKIDMPIKKANGYWGFQTPKSDGTWIDSDWVRSTTQGILPYQSGSAGNGHNSLGTSTWYWKNAYIDQIYGYLNGNISGNADKVDNYHVSTASGTTKNDSLNSLVPVSKQYFTTTSGYIVYANGLKIQWLRGSFGSNTKSKDFTFPQNFTASNTYGCSCVIFDSGTGTQYRYGIGNESKSGGTICCTYSTNWSYSIVAIGY